MAFEEHLEEAETKAWKSLSRYKFQMFGYWAAIWVHLNKISGLKRPNPFRDAVKLGHQKIVKMATESFLEQEAE